MDQYAPPTRITFITHAATHEQRMGAFPADEALDEPTVAKLTALGWIAPVVQQVWTGPEIRVRQTAVALNLNAIDAVALRECDYGTWRGCALEDLPSEDPSGITSWLTDVGAAPHGGEAFRELMTRVGRWLEEQRGTGHSIAITHASVVRAAIVHALNAPEEAFRRIEVAPLTITDLRLGGQHWHLRSVGTALASNLSHL